MPSGLQNDPLVRPLRCCFLGVVSESALLYLTPLAASKCPRNFTANIFSFSLLRYIYPISITVFDHPFPLFALVHPFIPTIPACLNNFHDSAIFFASSVWEVSTEGRACSSGEICLHVKTLVHNTGKSLH